jgi:hypothetical protein
MFGFNALRSGKSSGARSLVERNSMRMNLLPQTVAKEELKFSPTGYYDENTDINDIHKYVTKYFENISKDVPEINQKINSLRGRLSRERLQMIDRNLIQSQISKLEKQQIELTDGEKYKEYIDRTFSILEEFNSLQEKETPHFHFGEEKKFSPDKLCHIRAFIQIASDYTPLNLTLRPANRTGLCPYCRMPFADDEDDKIICYDCGIYQDSFSISADFTGLLNLNGANNNNYMNKETFDKCKKCYQGQQSAEFSPELRKDFDKYCQINRIVKSNLSYETTRPIFKEIKYPGYYEDINLFLFMHEEIRRPLPNISEHEADIDRDYDQFYQKFIEIKGDERDSGLNAWYLLLILLIRRNIPCNKCDIKVPETISIRLANDNIARKVFNALGWQFKDTI